MRRAPRRARAPRRVRAPSRPSLARLPAHPLRAFPLQVCELPAFDDPVTLLLRVRRGVGASGGRGRHFTIYDKHRPPFLSSLDPASAPCGVETTLTIRGRNFAPTGEQALVCSFQYL